MSTFAERQAACTASFRCCKIIQDSHTLNQMKINNLINQTRAWQQHDNPYKLEQSEAFTQKES
jgi:hypothetical protein